MRFCFLVIMSVVHFRTAVLNRGCARFPRGASIKIQLRVPLRALQHGKFLNGKVFHLIYLLTVNSGALKQKTITSGTRGREKVKNHCFRR